MRNEENVGRQVAKRVRQEIGNLVRNARGSRILLSYATAAGSKVTTALVQLATLPIVAHSLGAPRFGALLMLSAMASLLCVPAMGLSPAVSFGISRANGAENALRERHEFWAIAYLGLILGAVAGLLGWAGFILIDPMSLLGPQAMAFREEANAAVLLLAVNVAALALFSWVEGVRTGYQENHVNNIFSVAGSLVTLGGVTAAYLFMPTLWAYYLALNLSAPTAQALSMALAVTTRRNTLFPPATNRTAVQGALRRTSGFTAAQVGVTLQLQGGVYLIGRYFGLDAGAMFGALVRIMTLLYGVVLSLVQPILPWISVSIARGDDAMARRGVLVVMVIVNGVAGLIGLGILVAGGFLLEHWLHVRATEGVPFFALMGIFAYLYMSAHSMYLMFIILNRNGWASRRLFSIGALGVIMIVLLAPLGSLNLVVAGMMLPFLIFSTVLFPYLGMRIATGREPLDRAKSRPSETTQ